MRMFSCPNSFLTTLISSRSWKRLHGGRDFLNESRWTMDRSLYRRIWTGGPTGTRSSWISADRENQVIMHSSKHSTHGSGRDISMSTRFFLWRMLSRRSKHGESNTTPNDPTAHWTTRHRKNLFGTMDSNWIQRLDINHKLFIIQFGPKMRSSTHDIKLPNYILDLFSGGGSPQEKEE